MGGGAPENIERAADSAGSRGRSVDVEKRHLPDAAAADVGDSSSESTSQFALHRSVERFNIAAPERLIERGGSGHRRNGNDAVAKIDARNYRNTGAQRSARFQAGIALELAVGDGRIAVSQRTRERIGVDADTVPGAQYPLLSQPIGDA